MALCDQRTVDYKRDTFPIGIGYSEVPTTESLVIKYNKNYKWNYFYGIKPEEVLMIKLYVVSIPYYLKTRRLVTGDT
jgi:hypothetical protein